MTAHKENKENNAQFFDVPTQPIYFHPSINRVNLLTQFIKTRSKRQKKNIGKREKKRKMGKS